jgi:methylmalonyl-CoA mutase N-terminal domain/subunit
LARGTYIYPPGPSLRLITDTFRFCAAEVPQWNPISISGYHIREAGATAVQELAFTLSNTIEYVKGAIEGGLAVDEFAPRLSFFFAAHTDLFEEAAKFRAARRIYARLMRERFGASDASCRLRFHTQTGGVTLTAQSPLNNVVRVTIQALAAALGGTQSLHTNGYDEALSLPTREAATLALRTQQIAAYESGVASTVDPLAGSYFVEWLTDEVEKGALRLMERIEELGGAARAIESGFLHDEIGRSAYAHQLRVESGETTIVGVNRFADAAEEVSVPRPDYGRLEADQIARLRERRKQRHASGLHNILAEVREAARTYRDDANVDRRPSLMPVIIEAVRARATVGEIADVLREEWGAFVPA